MNYTFAPLSILRAMEIRFDVNHQMDCIIIDKTPRIGIVFRSGFLETEISGVLVLHKPEASRHDLELAANLFLKASELVRANYESARVYFLYISRGFVVFKVKYSQELFKFKFHLKNLLKLDFNNVFEAQSTNQSELLLSILSSSIKQSIEEFPGQPPIPA